VEGATQIDLDILPPDLGIAFPDWTEGPEGAVIVDQQVNRAELGRNPAERILDPEAIDQIDRDGDGPSALPVDEGRRFVYLACRSRQDGNLGAALRLMKRDLAPDPPSCAGDHGDGAVQPRHKKFLLICGGAARSAQLLSMKVSPVDGLNLAKREISAT
jgi:hypothetical protein